MTNDVESEVVEIATDTEAASDVVQTASFETMLQW